jgi:hypothetical protein
MISIANEKVLPPDAKGLKKILYTKRNVMMMSMKLYLPGKLFILTMDNWTSLATENYCALTIHLIDEFKLKTLLLSCAKHEDGAKEVMMEQQLVNNLLK